MVLTAEATGATNAGFPRFKVFAGGPGSIADLGGLGIDIVRLASLNRGDYNYSNTFTCVEETRRRNTHG